MSDGNPKCTTSIGRPAKTRISGGMTIIKATDMYAHNKVIHKEKQVSVVLCNDPVG